MGTFGKFSGEFEKELLSIIERHPMREEQIIETFKKSDFLESDILSRLNLLKEESLIKKIEYQGKIFWKLNKS